ncbi:MAG: histidinol-phosphatase, partial [Schwartzia sp.]|nr:histidinol-phosphatase [Schwartzia sp. (in: firmicutes)]
RIGSVHFLKGWAYDSSEIKAEWDERPLQTIYEQYAEEVEHLCAGGHYDALGHPFNIRLFKYLPDFDVTPYLERVAKAMKKADMVVDINTGTRYRYPIEEISPYPAFMEMAADYGLPIITTSDAHEPEDCGAYIDEAIEYARRFGYTKSIRFNRRDRAEVPLG